jgi:tRNA threonylcarbamoyl adenosine modification protein (Sua5/YciO/YrdC/YwlC family)
MTATLLSVDPGRPDPDILQRAASALASGRIVAYPTDTFYGLAVDPRNAAAVDRLISVKGRSADRAFPLIAADVPQIVDHIGALPVAALRLAERFWPGPLTLVVRAPGSFAPAVYGESHGVAVRVPDHAVAREVARVARHPITATSANRSGQPPAATARAVLDALEEIDLVLDGGPTVGGEPSTIVDLTGNRARLLRAGAVPWERVLESLR